MKLTLLVLAKELRELLREVNVLLLSIGFPFIFYPLLIWGVFQVQLYKEGLEERQIPRVVINAPTEVSQALLKEPLVAGEGDAAAIEAGDLDAILDIKVEGEKHAATLTYRSTESRSERAKNLLSDHLSDYKESRLDRLAERLNLEGSAVRPFEIEKENQTPANQMTSYRLSRALPSMFIAVMLLSALYPAVAVVVGERERGTLETTLVTAPNRRSIVLGKLLAIVTMVVIAVIGNAVAMGLTMIHLYAQMALQNPDLPAQSLSLAWVDLAMAGPTVMISALLVCAIMILSILPMRSFKEAQSVGSVVMTLGIALGFAALMPAMELNTLTALIPITNVALVVRDALNAQLDPFLGLLVAAENGILAAIILMASQRVVESEGFLFRGALPGWLRWVERFHDQG